MHSSLATVFSKTERAYTGRELRPHFLLTEMGLKGSALGAFIGPCSVQTEHLVDWEDRLAQDRIEARWMAHFMGEFFGLGLREGVFIQRLFMASLGELLVEHLCRRGQGGDIVYREGDDLFVGARPVSGASPFDGSPDDVARHPLRPQTTARKLSVSIVTASPVSVLLHTGINIDPEGAPVPAVGLQELGIVPDEWIPEALERFATEWEGVHWALAKVRPVM